MVPLKFGTGPHRGANLFIPTKKYHRVSLYSFWRHQLICLQAVLSVLHRISCPSFTLFTPSLLTTHTHIHTQTYIHTHTHVWVFLTYPSSLPPLHSQATVPPTAASCAWKIFRGTKYRCSCLDPVSLLVEVRKPQVLLKEGRKDLLWASL